MSDFSTLKKFSANLRVMWKRLGERIAKRAAPAITDLALATFNRSEDPYGAPWVPGFEGDKVTLRQSGKLAQHVAYRANGTKLRIVLGVAHAKYQIGKRPVFPRQNDVLPKAYSDELAAITQRAALEWVRNAA